MFNNRLKELYNLYKDMCGVGNLFSQVLLWDSTLLWDGIK